MRFPGQYAILGNGLYYNYHRDYDPSIGRYLQSDPIGLDGGVNTYLYAQANPLMYTDPYGLFSAADLPQLPQWLVDGAAGFGDAITFGGTDWIRDQMGTNSVVDPCSAAYRGGRYTGYGAGALTGSMLAARGMAHLGRIGGGTRWGYWINHNRYLRFGPGRMPANGTLPAGPKVPRMSVGPQRSGSSNPHFDLRVRPFD